MSYHAVSPSLRNSCYNCRHFQALDDMLTGICHGQEDTVIRQTIGIATCDSFTPRVEEQEVAL